MSSHPTVAVLGTGIMGAPMARNLLAAGLPVRVWNRSAEKAQPLEADGAVVAGSPREGVRRGRDRADDAGRCRRCDRRRAAGLAEGVERGNGDLDMSATFLTAG